MTRSRARSPGSSPTLEPYKTVRKDNGKSAGKGRQETQPKSRPLYSPSHRGFRPAPPAHTPGPAIVNVQASSQHAFAGRDEESKRPFRPPLGAYTAGVPRKSEAADGNHSSVEEHGTARPRSPVLPPTPSSAPNHVEENLRMRNTKSFAEGLRGLRHRLSTQQRTVTPSGQRAADTFKSRSDLAAGVEQASFRSMMTSDSSLHNTSTLTTDRSSIVTGNSSQSEFVHVYPNWPSTQADRPSLTVEDAIDMYRDGFESSKQSMDAQSHHSGVQRRPSSSPQRLQRPNMLHRRSQSASILETAKTSDSTNLLMPKPSSSHAQSSSPTAAGQQAKIAGNGRSANKALPEVPAARDRYGFKKISHYITESQYNAWDAHYTVYLERRRKKWQALMRSYGLLINDPIRFPPKSDKIKRYVRKGVPPEWRGAAWWWYAGGPGKLKEQHGLYQGLLDQVEEGKLNDTDRDLIERDLNRTFPDNIRFKPDPTTTLDAQAGAGGGSKKANRQSSEPEMPILKSLRRVLQAFAVHNPAIGYCQSLNFIAGLLLLFLDCEEEKSFILLNIVTSQHLPGTHGVALEGANIDIAVLMMCIKDTLPAVWQKLDDGGGGIATSPSAQALRLPTVSLATTAWFMSLFVGTLPIESVLRVWDCLFFEGSKTLFRIALAIFKAGERQILAVSDPMEIFQVVQTIPRSMVDVNRLMDVCFKRRGGFGHVSQGLIEQRRLERRRAVKEGVVTTEKSGLSKLRWRRGTVKI